MPGLRSSSDSLPARRAPQKSRRLPGNPALFAAVDRRNAQARTCLSHANRQALLKAKEAVAAVNGKAQETHQEALETAKVLH